MKSCFVLLFSFFAITIMFSQKPDTPPYYEIPDYPPAFTPENVVARMIDGLGFRFYWATEGLQPEDLSFKPSAEARTTEETIDHILGLSQMIVNAVKKEPNIRNPEAALPELSFTEKRKATLTNLKTASEMLKAGMNLEQCTIVFKNGDKVSEFPFWNLLNGPVADALWHCGQVVSFRRSSGNPFNSKANVFTGQLRQ